MFRAARREAGLTLLELVVASTMLLILATMALPMARVKIKRDREIELRRALREMRRAIDAFKDTSDIARFWCRDDVFDVSSSSIGTAPS